MVDRLVRRVDEPSYLEMQRSCVVRLNLSDEWSVRISEYRERYPGISEGQLEQRVFNSFGITKQAALRRWRTDGSSNAIEREEEFARVFDGLPLEADKTDVLSWIENHPAMSLSRPVPATGRVELVAEDIRNAPCRSAVGQLQHWVNKKDEFYREWIKRKPKEKEEEDREAIEQKDPTLKDVMKMLGDIGC